MTIVWKGPEFFARVGDRNSEPKKLQACILAGSSDMGVGYVPLEGDERASYWGLVMPCNMIVYWRATLLLSHLDYIGHGDLAACYYACCRNLHESDRHYRTAILQRVDGGILDKIMETPPPEEIIAYIIEHHDDDGFPTPDLYAITEEVHAGTLEWQEIFTEAEVPTVESYFAANDVKKKLSRFSWISWLWSWL